MIERCGSGCVRPIGHAGECRDSWFRAERCGYLMPVAGVPCARRRGHVYPEHRSREAMVAKAERLARAREKCDNVRDEYSVAIAYHAQRPGPRLYSESRGVDVPEYRRNG